MLLAIFQRGVWIEADCGTVLIASIAVLFLCLFVWLIFGLENDHGF